MTTSLATERKESLAWQTKKPAGASIVLWKRTSLTSPSLRRSLVLRTARPSVPLAKRPVSIRRGIPVFINAPIGMSGSKDWVVFLIPSGQGNQELESLLFSSSCRLQTWWRQHACTCYNRDRTLIFYRRRER